MNLTNEQLLDVLKTTITVDRYGNKYWFLNNQFHRIDGPAVEYSDGTKEWFLNGDRHRTNGPAVEKNNGDKFWFLNGKELTEDEFNKRTAN